MTDSTNGRKRLFGGTLGISVDRSLLLHAKANPHIIEEHVFERLSRQMAAECLNCEYRQVDRHDDHLRDRIDFRVWCKSHAACKEDLKAQFQFQPTPFVDEFSSWPPPFGEFEERAAKPKEPEKPKQPDTYGTW